MSRLHSRAVSALITLAGTCTVLADGAFAVTLPDSGFFEQLGGGAYLNLEGDTATPETLSGSALYPGYAYVSGWATTVGGTLPSASGLVNLTVDTDYPNAIFAGIYARVDYYWAVEQLGGDPYAGSVPIDVRARGGLDSSLFGNAGTGILFAEALIPLPGTAGSHMVNACTTSPCTTGPMSFDHSFTGMAVIDHVYPVTLTASGSGGAGYVGSTITLSAWVDPIIQISPTFDRRNDFRLVFSNGVSPIPEPASAWLAGAGLLGLVGWLRPRRCAPPARG